MIPLAIVPLKKARKEANAILMARLKSRCKDHSIIKTSANGTRMIPNAFRINENGGPDGAKAYRATSGDNHRAIKTATFAIQKPCILKLGPEGLKRCLAVVITAGSACADEYMTLKPSLRDRGFCFYFFWSQVHWKEILIHHQLIFHYTANVYGGASACSVKWHTIVQRFDEEIYQ